MSKFTNNGSFAYHIDGGYVQPVDSYEVKISSTYTETRFPDEKRKLLQIIVSGSELDILTEELTKIRNSNN